MIAAAAVSAQVQVEASLLEQFFRQLDDQVVGLLLVLLLLPFPPPLPDRLGFLRFGGYSLTSLRLL